MLDEDFLNNPQTELYEAIFIVAIFVIPIISAITAFLILAIK